LTFKNKYGPLNTTERAFWAIITKVYRSLLHWTFRHYFQLSYIYLANIWPLADRQLIF